MQTGILDWHHIGVGTRLVDVLMPVAGWCYERSTLHPVHADSVFDRAVRIQFWSDQGVYAGLGFYREIERDGLMTVRELPRTWRHNAKHGP